jgi:hypothetical protein
MGILIFTARFPSFFICTYQVSWGFHVETTDMFTARKGRNFQRFINRRDGWRAFPGKSRGARAAPCGTPSQNPLGASTDSIARTILVVLEAFFLSRWRSLLSVILVTCRHVQASVDPPGPGGARLGIQIPPCPINNPNVLF